VCHFIGVQFACSLNILFEGAIFVVFTSIHPTIVASAWTGGQCDGEAREAALG
jgi:hypothetical protein